MASLLRVFVRINQLISNAFDSALPATLRMDGNRTFREEVIPSLIRPNITIYDVGGGSQPCISAKQKAAHNVKLVGLDISAEELEAAPKGIYDEKIVADLASYRGNGDADVIVCQAVLEHISDNQSSIRSLAEILKPGGELYVFVPSRNAVFARLNMIMPQRWKEKILYTLLPHTEDHQGFPAFYDHCTPSSMSRLIEASGMEVKRIERFWISSYFKVFFPAFLLWRLWQSCTYLFLRGDAAETFILVAKKPERFPSGK